MRSAAEARAYLDELKRLLIYLGVSDCNMQEGSLRVDANVNLHLETSEGKVATPIVEIKNINSFRAVERALDYEAQRQYRVWQETGQKIGESPKQTRGWDDAAGITRGQRSKEESSDYRYFPDPDLAPITSTLENVEKVKATLGELPADLRQRLLTEHHLSAYDSDVLVNQGREVVRYFLDVVAHGGDAKAACNWVTQEILRVLKEREITIVEFTVTAIQLAELISSVAAGKLPKSRAKEVFELMLAEKLEVGNAIKKLGIAQVEESALTALCQELLDANPKIVADVQAGKQQAVGALIGQAKKKNPNVDPARVREICLELAQQE